MQGTVESDGSVNQNKIFRHREAKQDIQAGQGIQVCLTLRLQRTRYHGKRPWEACRIGLPITLNARKNRVFTREIAWNWRLLLQTTRLPQ